MGNFPPNGCIANYHMIKTDVSHYVLWINIDTNNNNKSFLVAHLSIGIERTHSNFAIKFDRSIYLNLANDIIASNTVVFTAARVRLIAAKSSICDFSTNITRKSRLSHRKFFCRTLGRKFNADLVNWIVWLFLWCISLFIFIAFGMGDRDWRPFVYGGKTESRTESRTFPIWLVFLVFFHDKSIQKALHQ